ncbi:MAG: hypothetical protein JNL98_19120 [Bryobacterales bacterium]|nr:hypothetical protein [Bryobacterales bacterium]
MIAYIFWHVPRAGVDDAIYTARLARFQEELEQAGPNVTGLSAEPASFRLDDVAWIAAGRSVYLDLYVMDGTAQMEILNTAAVSGDCKLPHDAVAELYGKGAGSLYQIRAGAIPANPQHSYWFAKPSGMTYAELDQLLAPLLTDAALLRRMMVLGPSPEFCILSSAAIVLPAAISHEDRPLTAV